jgi:hypothetical protein
MSADLRIKDSELFFAANMLSVQCRELGEILGKYRSIMEGVTAVGLHSNRITNATGALLAQLVPTGESLQASQVDVLAKTNDFLKRIETVDRF